MLNNSKFSVIIRSFNSAKIISKTIDSVLSQTYKNFEIIIVNDNANNDTQGIFNEYLEKYKSIKLINSQSNLSSSFANNIGLEKSSGDFVLFLEEDAWLEANALELLNYTLLESRADIVAFDYYKHCKHNKIKKINEKLNPQHVYINKEDKRFILKHANTVAWKKVYRKSFLNQYNIKFLDNFLYSDLHLHWIAVISAASIEYLPVALYNFRQKTNIIKHGNQQLDSNFSYEQSVIELDSNLTSFLIANNLYKAYINILEPKMFKIYHNLLAQNTSQKKLFFFVGEKLKKYRSLQTELNIFNRISAFLIKNKKYKIWKLFFEK